MKKPRSNRIAEVRKSRGLSQPQLAEALNVHWVTISKLERGVTKLNFDWAEKIGKILGVDPYDLMPPRRTMRKLALSAYVVEYGAIEAIDDSGQETFEFSTEIFDDIDTEWIVVKGDALYPYFKDGDIIGVTWVYDEERHNTNGEIDYSAFYGRFCLVENEFGDQYIGIIAPNIQKHLVNLHNANFPPISDVNPAALAQVTIAFMRKPMHVQETENVGK